MSHKITWADRTNHPQKAPNNATWEVNADILNQLKHGNNSHGWANYNDSGSMQVPQFVSSSTWTTIENDKIGPETSEVYLPDEVPQLYDLISQSIDLTGVDVGTVVRIRQDMLITPATNNGTLRMRLEFSASLANGAPAFNFNLDKRLAKMDEGGSIEYPIVSETSFFVGSQEIINGSIQVKVFSNVNLDIVNNGLFVWM